VAGSKRKQQGRDDRIIISPEKQQVMEPEDDGIVM